MNVRVEPNRFLSVACDPDERIVFDRKETRYHLLRDSAARLWDEICDGGTFEVAPVATEGEDPIAMLAEAGLLGVEEAVSSEGITRRVWLRRTGKVSAAAMVLPIVATITTPTLSLGQTEASVEEGLAPVNEPALEVPSNTRTRRRDRRREREEKPPREPRTRTRTRTRNTGTENTGTESTGTESTGTESGSSVNDLWNRFGRPNG